MNFSPFVVFAFLTCSVASADEAVAKLFRSVNQGVVTVLASTGQSRSQGSGFAISRSEVATNCHVIGFHQTIKVKHGEAMHSAKLSRGDYGWDVCVLVVEGLQATPLKINVDVPSISLIGSRVAAIGSPMGLELTLSEGIVSSIRKGTPGDLIQTTAAISPGSSGGPLLSMTGEVIGITTLQLRSAQSINFAVSSYVLKVLGDRIRYWSASAPGAVLDAFDRRDFAWLFNAVDRLSRDQPVMMDRHFIMHLVLANPTSEPSTEQMSTFVPLYDKSLPFFATRAYQVEKATNSPGAGAAAVSKAVFRILGYRKSAPSKNDERADDAWADILSLPLIHITTEIVRMLNSRGAEQLEQSGSGQDLLFYLDRASERIFKFTARNPESCSARVAMHSYRLLNARAKFSQQEERNELIQLRNLMTTCPNSITLHRILYSYSGGQQYFADHIKQRVREIDPKSERELAFVEDILKDSWSYVSNKRPQFE